MEEEEEGLLEREGPRAVAVSTEERVEDPPEVEALGDRMEESELSGESVMVIAPVVVSVAWEEGEEDKDDWEVSVGVDVSVGCKALFEAL